jgi:hypothetical protein
MFSCVTSLPSFAVLILLRDSRAKVGNADDNLLGLLWNINREIIIIRIL